MKGLVTTASLLTVLFSSAIFAEPEAAKAESRQSTQTQCTLVVPRKFAQLALTTADSPYHKQTMLSDNVVFIDSTPGQPFQWNYQHVMASLNNCVVKQKTFFDEKGALFFEIDIQGQAKNAEAEALLGHKQFWQNNLYWIAQGKPGTLSEYFFVGSQQAVAEQIKNRQASLAIKSNAVDSGLIPWIAKPLEAEH